MSGAKSRSKGCRGERDAARYLTTLGFAAERNGRNGYSTDDLRVPSLAGVHLEVKFGYEDMDIHTASLRHAWEQAARDIGVDAVDVTAAVLWKPPRKPWRLTWMEPCGLVTTTGDDAIKTKLLELNGGAT